MKELKFQILFFYYDRPRMAKNFALKSVLKSSYTNWELDFIDDGTDQDGDKVIEDFFEENTSYLNPVDLFGKNPDFRNKIKIRKTGNVRERGHSVFGRYANESINESDADITLMLCDDDALLQDYLMNLRNFYIENPDVIYSYSHLVEYDPSKIEELEDIRYTKVSEKNEYEGFPLNRSDCLNPCCAVDSSQVSWRRESFVNDGIKFPWPQTRDLDAAIYRQMQQKWGNCCWNKLTGEYKGWFEDQLFKRNSSYHSEDFFKVQVK